ncbi:MAG: UTP--glucose-1-phosphate uridylyltransferase GalU [Firmicutes bacterium]|nr:UTP--glucose-1-phosphate uridylyltransferase GalU [Bacillota bacterium]
MKVRKAIIPAAGLGTRFLPATKAQPKEMIPIIDKPAIQYIIEEVVSSGIHDILIITGRGKRSIEDHFDRSYELEEELAKKEKHDLLEIIRKISNLPNIHYIRQKQVLGLGHAIYCARTFVGDEPFAVLLGDDIIVSEKPCLLQMLEMYQKYKGSIIGVQEISEEDVEKYGILQAKSVEERILIIEDLIEKPARKEAPSNLAIIGRYIIDPLIFSILPGLQSKAKGEVQLTDALKILNRQKPVYGYLFEGKRYDVGDKVGYLKATIEFALHREDLKDEFKEYLGTIAKEIVTAQSKK